MQGRPIMLSCYDAVLYAIDIIVAEFHTSAFWVGCIGDKMKKLRT